jgi:hypothetical protein
MQSARRASTGAGYCGVRLRQLVVPMCPKAQGMGTQPARHRVRRSVDPPFLQQLVRRRLAENTRTAAPIRYGPTYRFLASSGHSNDRDPGL